MIADNSIVSQVNGEIAPLQNKIRKKESERDSMRQLLLEEEDKIAETLSGFKEMKKSIQDVVDKIKDFVRVDTKRNVMCDIFIAATLQY